jgi:hypothetical protein
VIQNCRGLGELARILQEQRGVLDHMHVAAAWVSLVKLGTDQGVAEVREVVGVLEEKTRGVLGEMDGPGIANVMHSLAHLHKSRFVDAMNLGESAEGLLDAMCGRALATAKWFEPHHVAMVLWALSTMGVTAATADRGLLEALQKRATATAGWFRAQNVANLLWALATMEERVDRTLLGAMQRRATATAGEYTPRDVANVLWALATMVERVDRGLLQAMQERVTATAGDYNPQDIANVLWALATMGEEADRGLLQALQWRTAATVGKFAPQNVANVLWALATMGWGLDASEGVLIDRLAARVLEFRHKFTQRAKSQLHQWLLSCQLDLVSDASLPSGVARVKLEMGEECLQAFSGWAMHESRFQRDVALALGAGGSELEIEEEYRDARSGYSIDILVRRRSAAGSSEWAVEVDGPFHFLGDGRTPSGSTLLKRKQLRQLGYKVVPVPFWEWDAARGDVAKRLYLADKFKERTN